ncbi:MAG: ATP-binding protein [Melioribacteraceae bacterium]|nr:ATP-binding protein [Melioribacteraceae bacterium]
MKINVRLLLITFVVVVIISLSSTFIYHSVTDTLLKNQHSQALLNSTSDFNFAFQSEIASYDEELINLLNSQTKSIDDSKLDFVFQLTELRTIILKSFIHSNKISKSVLTDSFDDFLKQYPNIVLKFYQLENGKSYFYGKIITEDYLNKLSEKIRAEIVLVINQIPYVSSHSLLNNSYFPYFIKAINNRISNQSFNLYYEELENGDFFSTNYSPDYLINTGEGIKFLLFTIPYDLAEFRDTMQTIAITISLTGILLSLVFVLLFTTKIRKQISLLSDAAKITAAGDLSHRVPIISKDELGNLGVVFNKMLDHIQSNELIERQYSELITIINETPLLKELCDAVLEKIISTTDVSLGVFYVVDNKNAKPISSYGINQSILEAHDKTNFHLNVIEKKKKVELIFEDNPPLIKTGLVEIKIRYLLVMPLVFNKKVIGVIELACEHIPENTPVDFLTKIMEQLAVGLNSALSYEQLENLVNELRILNEEYHKQNLQISEQNSELMELHKEFKKQAEELEAQRKKAVELTHVKSQFLANMSHELRTPLNSIIGLTELISDDASTLLKTKDRLKIVLRNGKKLLSMINNILEFSKIESGKFEVNKSNFILSEFILDIYNAMEPLVADSGLEFEINFNSEYDLLINSDKHKLEQILLNLLSNAIKFTERGKIEIRINIVNNISLQISVVDSGIGITDENKEIIFNEFEQGDLAKTKKYQGAGLGLAICKKYVELIDGIIEITTNEYNGSTFSILLNSVILEKFSIDRSFAFINKNMKRENKTKEVLILGGDEASTKIIAAYFENKNYTTINNDNLSDLLKIGLPENIDGTIINITNQTEKIWKVFSKVRTKNFSPIKLCSLSDYEKSCFILNVFDIITDTENDKRLNQIINIASIATNNIESILYIGESENVFKKEIANIDSSIIFNSSKDIGSIENFNENKKIDLIIVDAVIGNSSTLEKLSSEKSIPVLLYLSKLMVKHKASIIHNSFLLLAKQNSAVTDDVLKNIEDQFSLMKKAKKSVTSSIENAFSEKVALSLKENLTAKTLDGEFNVLVVDDDKDTLFTVGEILKNVGCKVTNANNGAECLSALENNKPDLILLDIMMPIMDGFETIKKIRINSETKSLLVYAITAQAMLDDLSIIRNNGFDDLITKPVNASTLSFKIQQAIQKRANKL